MKEYIEISEAYRDIKRLKEDFHYYQKYQEQLKKYYNNWPGPPESFSKEIWESSISEEIIINRKKLNFLEIEIKELHKIIKKMNRKQNEKNNLQNNKR